MTREEYEAKQNSLKKDVRYMPTGVPGEVKMVENGGNIKGEDGGTIDEKTAKNEWNKFGQWMDSKKMRGKPDLDKGDLGNKLFKQWQAETGSPLTLEYVPTLRQHIIKSIGEQKDRILKSTGNTRVALPGSGKLVWGEEARPVVDKIGYKMLENEKSANPNYIGSLFSTWNFPTYDIEEKAKTDPRLSKTISEFNANRDTTVPIKKINLK